MSESDIKRTRINTFAEDALEVSQPISFHTTDTTKEFPAEKFVEDFCAHRGFVPKSLVGTSDLEKKCVEHANDARIHFKKLLDAEESEVDVQSLNQVRKYERRLRNNRKSAAISKVFDAVLRRAQASILQTLSTEQFVELTEQIRILEQDRKMLLQDMTTLNTTLASERTKIYALQAVCCCNLFAQAERGNGLQTGVVVEETNQPLQQMSSQGLLDIAQQPPDQLELSSNQSQFDCHHLKVYPVERDLSMNPESVYTHGEYHQCRDGEVRIPNNEALQENFIAAFSPSVALPQALNEETPMNSTQE